MKPTVELIRLETKRNAGTFGILKIVKQVFCVTLEPPDRDNLKNVSSIPAGQYDCLRVDSATWGETFKVLDVPGRTGIVFHPGNRLRDTRGCILLAEHFGKLRSDRAVLNSGRTFDAFMGIFKDEGLFNLTIKEVF